MKKRFFIMVVILTVVFAGCSSGGAGGSNDDPPDADRLTIVVTDISGDYEGWAMEFDILEDRIPVACGGTVIKGSRMSSDVIAYDDAVTNWTGDPSVTYNLRLDVVSDDADFSVLIPNAFTGGAGVKTVSAKGADFK